MMFIYCVISSGRGRGVGIWKKLVSGSVVFTLLFLGIFFSGAKINAMEAETNNLLNSDSSQDLLNVSQTVNEVVEGVLKDLVPAGLVNINTGIPILNNPLVSVKTFYTDNLEFKEFFSPTSVSTDDLVGILRGVAVLSIQIFITVVSVVWQIAKGILQALNIDIGGL